MTNIAVIVLDTLRKDSFDEHFDWLPGVSYDNAWSTSHWTVPAHASLFTGKHGSDVPATKKAASFPAESVPWLPAQLQQEGYTTRAFSANAYLSWKFGFDRGFDEFKGSWRVRQIPRGNLFDWNSFIARHGEDGPERFPLALWECLRSDCDTLPSLKYGARLKLNEYRDRSGEFADDGAREALDMVTSTSFGDREFLFINLVEPHWPYSAPEEFRRVEAPDLRWLDATLDDGYDDPDRVRTAYEDEVRYLSNLYRDLFDALQSDFDVVVTCSDHGESLGEDGVWQHWHGIPPEVTNVPLSVHAPDEAFESTNSPVSLLDVHRTVSEIAGVSTESHGADLRRLLSTDGRTVGVEYHGLSPQHIEGMTQRGYDTERYDQPLYGVVTESAYHYETFDGFVGTDREAVEEFAADRDAVESREGELDSETRQQLEDLGYA